MFNFSMDLKPKSTKVEEPKSKEQPELYTDEDLSYGELENQLVDVESLLADELYVQEPEYSVEDFYSETGQDGEEKYFSVEDLNEELNLSKQDPLVVREHMALANSPQYVPGEVPVFYLTGHAKLTLNLLTTFATLMENQKIIVRLNNPIMSRHDASVLCWVLEHNTNVELYMESSAHTWTFLPFLRAKTREIADGVYVFDNLISGGSGEASHMKETAEAFARYSDRVFDTLKAENVLTDEEVRKIIKNKSIVTLTSDQIKERMGL